MSTHMSIWSHDDDEKNVYLRIYKDLAFDEHPRLSIGSGPFDVVIELTPELVGAIARLVPVDGGGGNG